MTQDIKEAYDLAKVMQGYSQGKSRALSDAEVCDMVGIRTRSMINKVLSGQVISKPTLFAILGFIRETQTELFDSLKRNQFVQEYMVTVLPKTQKEV